MTKLGKSRVSNYLGRLHVEDFCDPALHDQEMRIVDVQLDGAEEILDPVVLNVGSVDEVFVFSSDDDLSGDGDFFVVFVAHRRLGFVMVVEGDGHGGLGDAGLTVFVDQLLQIRGAHLRQGN